jgi:hypothetical protein
MEARALLGGDLPFVDPQDFWRDYEAAKRAALESGWTGGSQGEPRAFWLPNPHAATFAFGFWWRDLSTHRTVIVSPFALPWIADD